MRDLEDIKAVVMIDTADQTRISVFLLIEFYSVPVWFLLTLKRTYSKTIGFSSHVHEAINFRYLH